MVIPGLPTPFGDSHAPVARPEAPGRSPNLGKGARAAELPQHQTVSPPTVATTATSGREQRAPPPLAGALKCRVDTQNYDSQNASHTELHFPEASATFVNPYRGPGRSVCPLFRPEPLRWRCGLER